ncbi:septum site-determining protein MinC [Methylomarinum sp. Ch1-1]|uniref:Probable septum site-determining protein MinC n=1 Tax=Methylomarinum roseum TaxID=3067653 RepID=A0AAU7NYC3_9GAMM|nr:septum site-determining protein MinC [Methylomarinum sp. Ch1-1]MDP4521953.1 septum site-determining protein MinC [Methylomarinum sp. Ch1-1]
MSTDTTAPQKAALEFKSTSLNVPALMLISNNLVHIEHQLQEKIAQAPEFFKYSPVLIDLRELNKREQTLNLADIVNVLRTHHFLPIGIRGGSEEQNQSAIELNLPVHSAHASQPDANNPQTEKTIVPETEQSQKQSEPAAAATLENKTVTHPVRSGQRVYAKGDLIVTATVSAGAEIMAEGNIHVYGSLRGRALAGVQGNCDSRIFCSDLQAELISIAGNYKISDELDDSMRNKPVQISLQDQALIIEAI